MALLPLPRHHRDTWGGRRISLLSLGRKLAMREERESQARHCTSLRHDRGASLEMLESSLCSGLPGDVGRDTVAAFNWSSHAECLMHMGPQRSDSLGS